MLGSWKFNGSISNGRRSLFLSVPRGCTMCGNDVALFECKECYDDKFLGDGLGIASYCKDCSEKVHGHRGRSHHKFRPVLLPRVYSSENKVLDKQKMDLFAVVCIETSHYVAFVKCGVDRDSPWCFFDSMADRKGECLFLLGCLGHVI